jgi:signal transduction histidine kinase
MDAHRRVTKHSDLMTSATGRPPIEPLFALNERLWLRVWVATQAAAMSVACLVILAGGWRAFAASETAARTIVIVALLVAYHAAGVRWHGWMLRRPWAVFLFVPLGWALFVAAIATHGVFSVLLLGAILQGFVFLPFAWAIATLAMVMLVLTTAVIRQPMIESARLTIARVSGLLATGIMFGTVMLYIHRANRDAAIRARLLRQLDDAQRDLAARAREAGALEERQRLARDIHDTLAQGFTSVIKHLEAIELSFQAPGAKPADVLRGALPHVANAQAVSRASLAEIRRLVWALRPAPLDDGPLPAAIERLVAQWSASNGIATACNIGALPTLRPEAEVIILRATQEALSNAAKHARAAKVTIGLHCVDELVLLSVDDDGCGFAESDAHGPGKMGIVGMRERVRPLGGRVFIESEPRGGTSLTVALPRSAAALPA